MESPTRLSAGLDVAQAAWRGAGAPSLVAATTLSGACARCSNASDLVPVRDVISKVFTGFDTWQRPGGAGLCAACSWAYRAPDLRSAIHLVTRQPISCQQVDRRTAAAVLSRALEPRTALIVPQRPGRKHLLPTAQWGHITTDSGSLPWGRREAGLLELVHQLRADGFGTRMLENPTPPFHQLQRIPKQRWQSVLFAWRSLDPWRVPDSLWLPLALHLTTPPSAKDSR